MANRAAAIWTANERRIAVGLTLAAAILVFHPSWLAGLSAGDQLARRTVGDAALAEDLVFARSSPPTYVDCRGPDCEQRLNLRVPPGVYLWVESDGDTFVSRAMHVASPSVWVRENRVREAHREAATPTQRAARAEFLIEAKGRPPEPTPALGLQELVDALRDGNRGTRMRAGIELRRLGPSAAPAAPALVALLSIQEADLQAAVGNALLGIGPRSALPPLLEALDNPDRELAAAAAFHIGAFGSAARPAVPALLQALRDPSIRDGASAALEEIEKGG